MTYIFWLVKSGVLPRARIRGSDFGSFGPRNMFVAPKKSGVPPGERRFFAPLALANLGYGAGSRALVKVGRVA